MTLSTTENSKVYSGNGVTDTFAFPYKFTDNSQLVVKVDGVTKTDTVHYNASGVGLPTGGDVVFTAGNIPPTGTNNVSIERILPLTQPDDPQNFDGNPADSTETVWDKLVMMIQQVNDATIRTPKFAVGSITTTVIDEPVTGQFLIWDASGNLVNGGDASDIAGAQGYAAAAAVSETNAAASETAAGNSETAAAASAATAADLLNSVQGRDTVFLTFADSPYTATVAQKGTIFSIDTSGGAFVMNFPAIAGNTPINYMVKKTTLDSNNITVNATGDEFDETGSGVKTITSIGGFAAYGDTDTTPDRWTTLSVGVTGDGTVTWAKLAASLLASVADMVSGTANKILTAANFKTYMDDNTKHIVASGTIAEHDTELDNIGDGIFRAGYRYFLEVRHDYKANSTNGGPNVTYYNNADVEQTDNNYTHDGEVQAHADSDTHIQMTNYNWGVSSVAYFNMEIIDPKESTRETITFWNLYGIDTSPTTVRDHGAGHHKTVFEVNKVKVDWLVASNGGTWTLYEEKI